jgi:hypothetical protein
MDCAPQSGESRGKSEALPLSRLFKCAAPAIATRYDKLARNFLAGVQLASAISSSLRSRARLLGSTGAEALGQLSATALELDQLNASNDK